RLRAPIADVVGRKVKLQKRGKEHTGLCPFHGEKTPSFTVSDDKGFYHCFGCGAHGDVVKFVMESEGLAFPEAVERLAGEAGLALPAYSEGDRDRDEQRKDLYGVLDVAAGWFQSQLSAGIGRGATEYLEQRGLTRETIETFRLGFGPDNRTMMKQALGARKITDRQLVDTGLVIVPEDGGDTLDRFRNRIMFPITDPQGRVVAFGGRALGDAKAKYLNSPETSVFHKGAMLYNMASARTAARASDRVIVAEGYMDVIALAQAGFKEAVAPLGTALTEQQLTLLWRMAPEPILCFDGDKAGQRAAERALERALPHLKPGQSLRFAWLPEGEDPDSLIKANGAQAMRDVLDAASPLIDVLWSKEQGRGLLDTPERRAGFKSRLQDRLREIQNADVRRFYRDEMAARMQNLWQRRPARGYSYSSSYGGSYNASKGRRNDVRPVTRELLSTPLAKGHSFTTHRRERLLLMTLLNHPELLDRYEETLLHIDLASDELDKLRSAIIGIAAECRASDLTLETGTIKNHLQQQGLDRAVQRLEGDKGLSGDAFAHPDAAPEAAEKGFQSLLQASQLQLLQVELEAAEIDSMSDDEDEAKRAASRAQDLRGQIEVLLATQGAMENDAAANNIVG
ncbi:MAG: DNA primase, partial [Proteobacteria bacterium]|nr:DNA primase [Pseudomonadota bacterium]